MKSKLPKISDREKDVMSILWHKNEPMVASAIAKEKEGLSIHTVQNVIKKLLEKEYVVVNDIVYSGTVFSRQYRYVVTAEEYAAEQLRNVSSNAYQFSTLNFVDLYAGDDEEIWKELEQLIRERKKK
ncbi:MAG: BlaI/MecI/CopY family transcriptional regulator [Peptostreptococcaceae bacterium]|nr:BlaI/MecI/CopY family transcriptional regulator [Peptostreptococcaceae bacterium]